MSVGVGEFIPMIDVLNSRAEWAVATVDDKGAFRNRAGEEVGATAIAWIPLTSLLSPPAQRPFAALSANDGQFIPGAFGGFVDAPEGASVRWKHLGLGMIDLPTEQLASIQFQPTSIVSHAADADEVVLRNRDIVRGFVEKFGDPIILDTAGEKKEIAIDRIASLTLVNTKRPSGVVRVWIRDGTVIDGSAIRAITSGAEVSFILEGMTLVTGRPPLALMPEEILAVRTSGKRILALCDLQPTVLAPTTQALPRCEYPPPTITQQNAPLAAAGLEVRGPLRLIYEVPQGFTTFNATAEMPPSMRTWGDCVIVVRQDQRELARSEVSAKNPTVQIHIAIHAGPLEIEIEEGGGGPIGDTIILRRAMFVIAETNG